MIQHSLYSQDKDMIIAFFDKFDKEDIKNTIIEYLSKPENKNDTLEHCKEYSKKDLRRYYGNEIISFYENNPKTLKPSKVVTTKGSNKTFYKELT